MDLKKFKDESKKHGMGEASVYLLRKFQAMFSKLRKEMLKKTCHLIRKSGSHTTVGGAASEDIEIRGVSDQMRCSVSMHTEGASPVSIKTAKCGRNKLTVEFSADPGADHKIEYIIHT